MRFEDRRGRIEQLRRTDVDLALGAGSEGLALRALVADDDDWTRNLLRHYLLNEGVEVDAVRTGDEAIVLFTAKPPDIVFLDVEMPGKTGLDVLALIREHALDTAIVISTAYGNEEVVATALRRGADDYLRKPFERGDLQAVLDRTIARLLLTRQNTALRARLLDHQRQLDEELARAAAVVGEMMPSQAPPLPGFDLAAACLSARELGGDFYDWQVLPDGRLSLTVGDVMGKGLPAALLMATVRAVLRAVVPDHGPAATIQRTAIALDHDLGRSGAFVTLFHAQIDPATGEVAYVDAGHGYVLLRRQDGRVEELRPWGLPIGVDAQECYEEGRAQLAPGDALVVYSDGLSEARPDLFSLPEGVAVAVAGTVGAHDMVGRLVAAVTPVRPLPDDLTVVALRRLPVAAVV